MAQDKPIAQSKPTEVAGRSVGTVSTSEQTDQLDHYPPNTVYRGAISLVDGMVECFSLTDGRMTRLHAVDAREQLDRGLVATTQAEALAALAERSAQAESAGSDEQRKMQPPEPEPVRPTESLRAATRAAKDKEK